MPVCRQLHDQTHSAGTSKRWHARKAIGKQTVSFSTGMIDTCSDLGVHHYVEKILPRKLQLEVEHTIRTCKGSECVFSSEQLHPLPRSRRATPQSPDRKSSPKLIDDSEPSPADSLLDLKTRRFICDMYNMPFGII